jgi:hypothetical protein
MDAGATRADGCSGSLAGTGSCAFGIPPLPRDVGLRPVRGFAKEVTTMSKLGTLLSFAAILALVCGVAGDAAPTKQFTRPCELSGDATGGGEVGVKAWSYGPLTMTIMSGGLQTLFGCVSGSNAYSGPGRVLDNRLDFYFDPSENPLECGPFEDNDGIPRCPYRLILLDGVYDQQAETVTFEVAEALLVDYTVPDPYTLCEGTADLVVQFTDGDGGGDETESEKGWACEDGVDNDGDGLEDCDDPDCKNWKACK